MSGNPRPSTPAPAARRARAEAGAGGVVMTARLPRLVPGDCIASVAAMEPDSVDAIVTDPPYELGFMGRAWDRSGIAFDPATWAAFLRVLKPGGHLVAFAAPRNAHRMICAIEDAGFEIRDGLMWLFGTGFPKSLDVSKALDKAAGAVGAFGEAKTAAHQRYIEKGKMRGAEGNDGWQRPWMDDPEAVANAGRQYIAATPEAAQWAGWGTALKPAYEPITLARKPLDGTVAANVARWGTGALNIDGCRVRWESEADAAAAAVGFAKSRAKRTATQSQSIGKESRGGEITYFPERLPGRWPANIVHDGSAEVVAAFPETGVSSGGIGSPAGGRNVYMGGFKNDPARGNAGGLGDSGSAARFFYSAKADADDRLGSKHPTVKPVDLMAYLCRLVTPPGGTVLDPFAGSGTTGMACMREGFSAILIEREAEYIEDIKRRIAHVSGQDAPLFASAK